MHPSFEVRAERSSRGGHDPGRGCPEVDTGSSIGSLVCEECWAGPFAYDTFRRLTSGEDIPYTTTWARISESATGGCGFCGLLVTDMPEDLDDGSSVVTFTVKLGFVKNPTSLLYLASTRIQFLDYEIAGPEGEPEFLNNGMWLRASPDDPAATEIVARDPVLEVSSPRCYSFASAQMEDCAKNHKDCPAVVLDSRLPTRVIDCLDPLRPRLFASEGKLGQYAALSYVWGEAQPHSTTEARLDAYTNSIDISIVPRTIREAIEVTHKLGLRYLWVDSFCIIQDSREDKTRELVLLRRIFHDAYITIVAACAPSASAGFLHDRPSPVPSPKTPRLPYWCADGRLGTVTAEPFAMSYEWDREPINKRAWCLEERLMSPRKLVYASDTLQYHCQTGTTAVGGAVVRAQAAERLRNVAFMSDAEILPHVSGWNVGRWKLFSGEWADVLLNYTRRAVTKPKDKLTALAGVAEQLHSVFRHAGDVGVTTPTRNRYPAGLWEPTLVNDLLWRRTTEMPLSARPSQYYLAPTWSWASVDGPISLLAGYDVRLHPYRLIGSKSIRCAKIVSCDVTLEDERLPHGRVKSGLLQLQTKLIPTTWIHGLEAPRLYLSEVEPGGSLRMAESEDLLERDASRVCAAELFLDSTDKVKGEVWTVPILWNVDASRDFEDVHATGLLVAKAEDEERFVRVGFWETPELGIVDDPEEYQSLMQTRLAWFETFDDPGSTLPVIELI
ncbi:HET-domain-containing protein [Cubamyces sp. BRFM 1775]|nr:HET-domain-containing protein [Cubamyces sp. BRFM 1775]